MEARSRHREGRLAPLPDILCLIMRKFTSYVLDIIRVEGSKLIAGNRKIILGPGALSGTSGGTYLGRPWGDFAQVAFQNTNENSIIIPAGWEREYTPSLQLMKKEPLTPCSIFHWPRHQQRQRR